MKPVLMIHEVDERIFELPLEDYILTFDDGLYTQYKYHKRFAEIDTQKIYFISTGIICRGKQSTQYIRCDQAHQLAKYKDDFRYYMTYDQIKEVAQDDNTFIGGHSHAHHDLTEFSSLKQKVDHIQRDTMYMVNWFLTNLGYIPTKFCYPYNEDMDGLYGALLKKYGITELYGRERIPVETLLHNHNQSAHLGTEPMSQ